MIYWAVKSPIGKIIGESPAETEPIISGCNLPVVCCG